MGNFKSLVTKISIRRHYDELLTDLTHVGKHKMHNIYITSLVFFENHKHITNLDFNAIFELSIKFM